MRRRRRRRQRVRDARTNFVACAVRRHAEAQPVLRMQWTKNNFHFLENAVSLKDGPGRSVVNIYYLASVNWDALNEFQLEPGSQKEILGLAVGANPLGQLLFSPILGYWANRAGSARAPLLATLVLFVLASVLYSQLHLTRPHAKYWMVLARFLVGVSSGRYYCYLCRTKRNWTGLAFVNYLETD